MIINEFLGSTLICNLKYVNIYVKASYSEVKVRGLEFFSFACHFLFFHFLARYFCGED